MKFLWRFTMISDSLPYIGKGKTATLYVIKETKEEAIEYVNNHKQDSYAISSVACLCKELSGIMFRK